MRGDADALVGLERRIYEAILDFPQRIDDMETRSEESCRQLARRIAAIVAAERRSSHGDPAGR